MALVGPDAEQHLELVVGRGPAGPRGQVVRDVDQPRVVRGHHRVALALHEDGEAADVGAVDGVLALEGDRLRLGVRALHQPDARPGPGEVAAVGLGAAQHRLQHASDPREVLPQRVHDGERPVDGRVVLHVERDRGPDGGGRCTVGHGGYGGLG